MRAFYDLIERRIQAAAARGELEGLEGSGRPLDLEEDPFVPEELRMAYRILGNAGFTPPEVTLRNEIAELERQLASGETDREETLAWRRLALLRTRLSFGRGVNELGLVAEGEYQRQLARRLRREGGG